MNEWISVKDRLPPTPGGSRSYMVLVAVCWGRAYSVMPAWLGDGEWIYFDGLTIKEGKVTHWQPLPTPPTAKEL